MIQRIDSGRTYHTYSRKDLDRIPMLRRLSPRRRLRMKAVAAVIPFRVNDYVLEELIDWDRIPEDPLFRLTFPQPEMLEPGDLSRMSRLVRENAPAAELRAASHEIQRRLNPHPAGQREHNRPVLDGIPLPGMQRKYRETVLFFPAPGQTCHAYCTYCFRWAQFVGVDEHRFAAREAEVLVRYLRQHPEITDVLITGGDPLIMRSRLLRRYVEPLLDPRLAHVRNIRIGTKAPAYWPYRFLTDPDAGDLLRLFEEVVRAGRHLALMAHFTHPRELSTHPARSAVRAVRGTGAMIRSQSPVVRHVNDSARVWASLWRRQVSLGVVPYYMFVARDTGAQRYFRVPLAKAFSIFTGAFRSVSGLARTVRGPTMSALPGKILVDGIERIGDETVFLLKLIQARDPSWVGRVFLARYDPEAAWFDDLRPAFGEPSFFWGEELRALLRR